MYIKKTVHLLSFINAISNKKKIKKEKKVTEGEKDKKVAFFVYFPESVEK